MQDKPESLYCVTFKPLVLAINIHNLERKFKLDNERLSIIDVKREYKYINSYINFVSNSLLTTYIYKNLNAKHSQYMLYTGPPYKLNRKFAYRKFR